MRILMVTHPLPTPKQPGTMAPVARQIESLRSLGHQVQVLEIKGVAKLKYFQVLPAHRALVPGVDVVHAHFGYCGWLARSQFSKPLIVSFMGDDLLGTPDAQGQVKPLSKLAVRINQWLARNVDAVIVKSAEMAKIVAPVKAHIVPNGVDLKLFRPLAQKEARLRLDWPENKHYILFPSNPDNPRKGYRLAQSAVRKAGKRLNVPLELVPLWGVAPDQVPLYMNACQAMLMTSFIEGSPNVVKEAMACNLPVVSVPVGDVPELLADVKGSPICPYDSTALATELIQILSQPYRSDGRIALQRKGLDLDSVAHRVLDIYTQVLNEPVAL